MPQSISGKTHHRRKQRQHQRRRRFVLLRPPLQPIQQTDFFGDDLFTVEKAGQVVSQRLRRRIALFFVFGKTARTDDLQRLWQSRSDGAQKRRLARHHAHDQVDDGVVVKRCPSRKHFKQRRAEAVHITATIQVASFPTRLLGRHKRGRTHHGARLCQTAAFTRFPRQTKVHHHRH
ncbi:MAG TPA: hypothetical protein PKW11_03935, partial [Pseudomonadota bacterium]|nr:hypothetical protein [Pseudomonadota bacterium]